ncbi:MAG: DNA (cytosine-5-)-methyltransferase, partial [Planctomycetes bacterium]|nr:DNA (cytosine-5-)-methyltransferase [Planctomycetota bacterium]
MRIAFERAGGKCVFTSEWDKFASKTYATNFGDIPTGDITKVKSGDIPPHNVLLAGFPCQPFSNAGLKLGFNDTRGTLFFDVARIIKKRRPEMVLLENVKGFVIHDRGRTHAVVQNVLKNLGYEVHSRVLNASDFGVPQNRERIYIVAIRADLTRASQFEFPVPPKTSTRVGRILEKRVDTKYTLSNKLWRGHKRRLREHRERGNGFGYSLFGPESSRTSTISARYYKDGSEILIRTRGNPRKITPRE